MMEEQKKKLIRKCVHGVTILTRSSVYDFVNGRGIPHSNHPPPGVKTHMSSCKVSIVVV
jgi:hypothetical protein